MGIVQTVIYFDINNKEKKYKIIKLKIGIIMNLKSIIIIIIIKDKKRK